MTGATVGYVERESWLTRAILDDRTAVSAAVQEIIGGEPGKPSRGVVLEVLTGNDVTDAAVPHGFFDRAAAAAMRAVDTELGKAAR